ncbi:MAG: hypothetical protein JXB50_15050 [Spirochaetes bacterium]|nr:hypothetical protein [Spirochaetota bacterium]
MKNKFLKLFLILIIFSCSDKIEQSNKLTYKGYEELKNNNPKNAIKTFNKAISYNERNIDALYGIAESYKKLNDINKIKESLIRLLSIDKNNEKAIFELAKIYYNESNYEDSFQILKNCDSEQCSPLLDDILYILIKNSLKTDINSLNYKNYYEYLVIQNRKKPGYGKNAAAVFIMLDLVNKNKINKKYSEKLKEIMKFLDNEINLLKPEVESDSIVYLQKGYEMAEIHGRYDFKTHEDMCEEFINLIKKIYLLYHAQGINIKPEDDLENTKNRAKIFYYTALRKKFDSITI